jgi:hypothetical protein
MMPFHGGGFPQLEGITVQPAPPCQTFIQESLPDSDPRFPHGYVFDTDIDQAEPLSSPDAAGKYFHVQPSGDSVIIDPTRNARLGESPSGRFVIRLTFDSRGGIIDHSAPIQKGNGCGSCSTGCINRCGQGCDHGVRVAMPDDLQTLFFESYRVRRVEEGVCRCP